MFLLRAFRFWFKSELTRNGHTEYVWCILISLQVNYAQMLPFFLSRFENSHLLFEKYERINEMQRIKKEEEWKQTKQKCAPP